MTDLRPPRQYHITKKVRQHFARISGYPVGDLADPMIIFPRIRATIYLSPRATAELLGDPRRAAEAEGTFWLSTDGRLLWVIMSARVISVIELTREQTDRAMAEHGVAMRARVRSVAEDYDPAPADRF